jgi:2-polyprenyl-6-methoxyphenol hydroxylase-like FAD-dependent oxidoreductase
MPCGRLQFCDGSAVTADLVVAADGVNSPLRDSLGLLRRRRPAGQFGYRAMIRRQPDELSTDIGRTHCEHWSGFRRLLYAPCTADLAYVQLTSLAGDDAGNQVPIDRDCWYRAFPLQDWIIDRLPDQGHSDWFERVQVSDWSSGRVALVGDAASAQPPFLGQGGGCAMMSGFALAEAVEWAGDVIAGIDMWKRRQRRLIEWVQRVSYWYGQLAFCPAPVRTAAFKAIGRSGALKRATLLVAARHDPTAADYWYEREPIDAAALVMPLMH